MQKTQKNMELEPKKEISPKEFAKMVNRSVSTLVYWRNKGYLVPHRNEANRPFYTIEQYNAHREESKLRGENYSRKSPKTKKT